MKLRLHTAPPHSDPEFGRLRAGVLAGSSVLTSCDSVKFYEKQALADPIMTCGESPTEAHFVAKNTYSRLGSIGGVGSTAGGGLRMLLSTRLTIASLLAGFLVAACQSDAQRVAQQATQQGTPQQTPLQQTTPQVRCQLVVLNEELTVIEPVICLEHNTTDQIRPTRICSTRPAVPRSTRSFPICGSAPRCTVGSGDSSDRARHWNSAGGSTRPAFVTRLAPLR